MKIKTSELAGRALDWAVAKCEEPVGGYKAWVQADLDKGVLHGFNYSTDWLWGGPIIEREGISVRLWIDQGWCAYNEPEDSEANGEDYVGCSGPTPLIAAMRCYVASKLGDEVEIPEDLA